MPAYAGKVALVTGAAAGIGLATAERLHTEGAAVVLADINAAAGQHEAARLGGAFVALDVGRADAWRTTVAGIVERHGGLDLVCLNAGVTTYPVTAEGFAPFDIAALPDDVYRRILAVNVDGVVFGIRAVTPALAARGGGAIVVMASIAGLSPFPADPLYTLTKHAVVGLVRGLAPGLRKRGITLNAMCPGGVDTALVGPRGAERLRAQGVGILAPAEVADAVMHMLATGPSGTVWVCQAGAPLRPYEFAAVG